MKMSEDPKKALETKEEEEVVETPEEEVVQLSPLEEEAKSQGWLPKEEWEAAGNDPDEWRSAKEFKDRGELYKSIHTAKRELQQTKQALTALQRHHKHVFEQAHNKAVKELKKARREALRDGEVERVDEIEQDLEVLENEHKEAAKEFEQAPAVQTGVHPSFEAWLPANRWYEKDAELRDYADFVGLKYSKDHPGVSPEEVLKHVSQRVKNQFPDKFGARRAAPSPLPHAR